MDHVVELAGRDAPSDLRDVVHEGTLIPGYHYVEIRPDYSDLEERMRYYIEHPDEAEAIIAHAHEYVAQFRDRRREKIISLLVLQNYFRRTGQR